MPGKPELRVVDTSRLTDADWVGVNKVKRAYEARGADAFWDELETLGNFCVQIRIAGAFFPDLIREALKDELAERGITREDLLEALRTNEGPTNIH